MVPIPQYPLYSALIAKLTGTQVNYHLDEERSWSTSKETLEAELKSAQKDGIVVKALVLINPGALATLWDRNEAKQAGSVMYFIFLLWKQRFFWCRNLYGWKKY